MIILFDCARLLLLRRDECGTQTPKKQAALPLPTKLFLRCSSPPQADNSTCTAFASMDSPGPRLSLPEHPFSLSLKRTSQANYTQRASLALPGGADSVLVTPEGGTNAAAAARHPLVWTPVSTELRQMAMVSPSCGGDEEGQRSAFPDHSFTQQRLRAPVGIRRTCRSTMCMSDHSACRSAVSVCNCACLTTVHV